jgi:hypothetical protein
LIFKNHQSAEAAKQGELFKRQAFHECGRKRQSVTGEIYCKAKQEREIESIFITARAKDEVACYGQQAFELLVNRYGLIDPTKYNVRNLL